MIQQNPRKIATLFSFMIFFTLNSSISNAWGFFAHKLINRQAVFSLPTPLFNFYKYYIYTITEESIIPDIRRSVMEEEGARHFIDLDYYNPDNSCEIPHQWQKAIEKFSTEILMNHGIAPWNLTNMKHRLTTALKARDVKQIIKISAEIGHYAADINVPLHTSENYNGQFTNQQGIHSFWESRLPELFADDYDLFIGTASYIDDLNDRIWTTIQSAHSFVNILLELEKGLSEEFPLYLKYSFEQHGTTLQKVYSIAYSRSYHTLLEGMVERQMRSSIKLVSDIWYTCWIDAGAPDLDSLIEDSDLQNDKLLEELKEEGIKLEECPKTISSRDCY